MRTAGFVRSNNSVPNFLVQYINLSFYSPSLCVRSGSTRVFSDPDLHVSIPVPSLLSPASAQTAALSSGRALQSTS